jgi:hypothetical protein
MSAPSRIGGTIDYAALAQMHRPADPQAMVAEIRRLHGTGLTPRDISVALHIALAQVLESIGEPSAHDTTTQQATRST